MRILIACETYTPDLNGAAVFATRLAHELARRGHETHVVSPSPVGSSYQEDLGDVRVHRVPSRRYPWHKTFHIADFRKVSRAVRDVVEDVRPDVVHLQAHLVIGRRTSVEARRAGIPLVATNHFMPDNLRGYSPVPLPDFIYRTIATLAWRDLGHIYGKADIVTAPTPHAVKLLESHARIQDVLPISCGVDISKYQVHGPRNYWDSPTILFVGRLDREKHIDELIDALGQTGTEVRLRIVGQGSQEDQLRARSESSGVRDRIDFLGRLTDDQVRYEYSRADVFCMPGVAELQSIATLEAMASGLPIIAADAHALPLLVIQGANGELYTPGDIDALTEALNKLLSNRALARRYGETSVEAVRKHDFEITTDTFEKLYLRAAHR